MNANEKVCLSAIAVAALAGSTAEAQFNRAQPGVPARNFNNVLAPAPPRSAFTTPRGAAQVVTTQAPQQAPAVPQFPQFQQQFPGAAFGQPTMGVDGSQFQFVPGTGYVPTNDVTTRPFTGAFNQRGAPLAVTGNTNIMPTTGFGPPAVGYGGYGGYPGAVITSGMPGGMVNGMPAAPGMPMGAGMNMGMGWPAAGGGAYAGAMGGGNGSYAPTVITQAPRMSREQTLLVQRAEALMLERPMREGVVVETGASVRVQYRVGEETETAAFAPSDVFFFRSNGELATAATASRLLNEGDRVLIPTPDPAVPRQAVAGSREEIRGGAQTGEIRGTQERREESRSSDRNDEEAGAVVGETIIVEPQTEARDERTSIQREETSQTSRTTVREKVAGSRESYSAPVREKVAGSRQNFRRTRRPAH